MAVIILPDAQADLLSLQDYMLDQWGEAAWVKAEDEIFAKLERVDSGILNGTCTWLQGTDRTTQAFSLNACSTGERLID